MLVASDRFTFLRFDLGPGCERGLALQPLRTVLETDEVAIPESLVRFHPLVHVTELFAVHAVHTPPAMLRHGDEPGLAEDAQVL